VYYEVRADIGGKIAPLGARLIDSTAKRLAAEFFTRLTDLVGEAEGATVPA
jgi:carbon monoxide dehydrogenase subunit G